LFKVADIAIRDASISSQRNLEDQEDIVISNASRPRSSPVDKRKPPAETIEVQDDLMNNNAIIMINEQDLEQQQPAILDDDEAEAEETIIEKGHSEIIVCMPPPSVSKLNPGLIRNQITGVINRQSLLLLQALRWVRILKICTRSMSCNMQTCMLVYDPNFCKTRETICRVTKPLR
jgi:hypothetical protein